MALRVIHFTVFLFLLSYRARSTGKSFTVARGGLGGRGGGVQEASVDSDKLLNDRVAKRGPLNPFSMGLFVDPMPQSGRVRSLSERERLKVW
jgi:hypothetical protein